MKKLLLSVLTFLSTDALFGFGTIICMKYTSQLEIEREKNLQKEITELLTNFNSEWRYAVSNAILNNNFATLKELCYTKKHANTIIDPVFNTVPLYEAATKHKKEIIEYLCSIGADVNALDSNNQTPLLASLVSIIQHAMFPEIDINIIECIKLLLEKGSDVSLKGGVLFPLQIYNGASSTITVDPVEYLLFNISNNFKSAAAIKLLELFIPYSSEAVDYFSTHNPQVLLKYIKLSHAQKNNTPDDCSIVSKIFSQQLGFRLHLK